MGVFWLGLPAPETYRTYHPAASAASSTMPIFWPNECENESSGVATLNDEADAPAVVPDCVGVQKKWPSEAAPPASKSSMICTPAGNGLVPLRPALYCCCTVCWNAVYRSRVSPTGYPCVFQYSTE